MSGSPAAARPGVSPPRPHRLASAAAGSKHLPTVLPGLGGAVRRRGGYCLKHQDYRIGDGVRSIGQMALPLSEGQVDRTYAQVGAQLLWHAVRQQPLVYTFGDGRSGGTDYPLCPRRGLARDCGTVLLPRASAFCFSAKHPGPATIAAAAVALMRWPSPAWDGWRARQRTSCFPAAHRRIAG